MPYGAEISRMNPSCFLFLVDQSGSMADPWTGAGTAEDPRLAAEVATILNGLLRNLVLKCSKDDGVRAYFDVGVLGYGAEVGPALGGALAAQPLLSIADLADAPLRIEDRRRTVPDGLGGTLEQAIRFPVWCEPVAKGGTPMRAALAQARQILEPWVQSHPRSHPPVVFHITDGESTDGDPRPGAEELRRLETEDGPLLLFTVHLSARAQGEIAFPADPAALADPYARLLCEISSDLPDEMRQRVALEGYPAPPGARGFIFNAGPAALVSFLDVGTRPANLR